MPNIRIGITTISFSKNKTLLDAIKQHPHFEVKSNIEGKRFQPDELVDFLHDCDGAIVGLDKVHDDLLSACPRLKIISKYGVGLDNIDFAACSKHNVKVGHTPGVNKRSVAEMALGFMLGLCRNLYPSSLQLKRGDWKKGGGIQLSGKTVGIIGVGHIGKEVVSLLRPFGCRLLLNDIIDIHEFSQEHHATIATKEEIYREADIITLHTPLTEKTEMMINRETLAMMKSSAFLLNTARGGLVDLEALHHALTNGIIAGAALDVYDTEPPDFPELMACDGLFCTPHIGGNAREAVEAMGYSAIEHIVDFFQENSISLTTDDKGD